MYGSEGVKTMKSTSIMLSQVILTHTLHSNKWKAIPEGLNLGGGSVMFAFVRT